METVGQHLQDAVDALNYAGGPLEGYDGPQERLFAGLVAGIDRYARMLCASEATDLAPSMATVLADAAALETPSSFANMETFRYHQHLLLTLTALEENLIV
jgi:hypothetical protein